MKKEKPPAEEPKEEVSISDYLGAGVKNALDTFIMQGGLQAQGLGLQIADLANADYYKNNPDAPVAKVAKGLGGALGKIGESALDMYNEDASHHTSEEWQNTALGDSEFAGVGDNGRLRLGKVIVRDDIAIRFDNGTCRRVDQCRNHNRRPKATR